MRTHIVVTLLLSLITVVAETTEIKSSRSGLIIKRDTVLSIDDQPPVSFSIILPTKQKIAVLVYPSGHSTLMIPANFPYFVTHDQTSTDKYQSLLILSATDRAPRRMQIIDSIGITKSGEVEFTAADIHSKLLHIMTAGEGAMKDVEKELLDTATKK